MILWSLVAAFWFAALTKGAHDLWAATALFAWLTFTSLAFLISSYIYRKRIQIPFLLPLSISFILLSFSSISSYDLNTTQFELRIWLFTGVAFFLCINCFSQSATNRSQFVRMTGLVILPVAIEAVAEFFRDAPSLFALHWSARSTFPNSTVLAGFAMNGLILLWPGRNRSHQDRWLLGGCLVILSLARSWWAFICLGIGFMYYYRGKVKIAEKHQFIFLMLVISVFVFKWNSTDRLLWWLAALRMIAAHPLTGVGLGGYATALPYFKSPSTLNTLFVHSAPLQLATETGMLGVLGIGFSIFYILRPFRSFNEPENAEQRAYHASILAALCFSLITIYLDYFVGKLMLAMSIALSLSQLDLKSTAISKFSLVGTVLILLGTIPFWYLPFEASQAHTAGLEYAEKRDMKKAQAAFQEAIEFNPIQAESYAALARCHLNTFLKNAAPKELDEWEKDLSHAYRYKKDIRYKSELSNSPLINVEPPQ